MNVVTYIIPIAKLAKRRRRTRGPQSAAERELSRAKMQALNAARWAGSPGTYLTGNGYLRHSRGPDRGKFVHRTVMAALCAVSCVYPLEPKSGLPAGLTVEHLDHVKTHNCPGNIILLDKVIHDYISNAMWRNGCYLRGADAEVARHYRDGEVDWRAVAGAEAEAEEPPF